MISVHGSRSTCEIPDAGTGGWCSQGPALAVAYGVGQVINWELQLIVEYSFEQHGFF
jgi:hypothetical protein